MAEGEALYVDEEEALVPEVEAVFASADPGVGVAEAAAGVVGFLLLQAGRSVPSRPAAWTRPTADRGWLLLSLNASLRSQASMILEHLGYRIEWHGINPEMAEVHRR